MSFVLDNIDNFNPDDTAVSWLSMLKATQEVFCKR